jgi:transposase
MWTNENRARYDRSHLRYPSDLTDDEWKLVEPLIPPGRRGGDKRTVIMREIVNGLMYILSTGCQWRAIPRDLRAALDVVRLFRPMELGSHARSHTS